VVGWLVWRAEVEGFSACIVREWKSGDLRMVWNGLTFVTINVA
jgi:hypothetical protein